MMGWRVGYIAHPKDAGLGEALAKVRTALDLTARRVVYAYACMQGVRQPLKLTMHTRRQHEQGRHATRIRSHERQTHHTKAPAASRVEQLSHFTPPASSFAHLPARQDV